MQKIGKKSLNIRRATIDDIQYIAELKIDNQQIREHSHPVERMMNELFLQEYKKRWEKKLKKGVCTLILSAKGTIVGFINFCATDGVIQEKVAEIDGIYVTPIMRGQGLGRLLCKTALDRIKKEQVTQTVVWLEDGSYPMLRFFRAMGFLPTSRIRLDKIGETQVLKEIQYQIILKPGMQYRD